MSQRRASPETADRYDPTQPYYEAYQIDFEFFHLLFTCLSTWGQGTLAEALAARLFRVGIQFISKVQVSFYSIFYWYL